MRSGRTDGAGLRFRCMRWCRSITSTPTPTISRCAKAGPNPTWLQIVTQDVPRLRRSRLGRRDRRGLFPLQVLSADSRDRGRTDRRLRHRLAGTASGRDGGTASGSIWCPPLVRLLATPEAAALAGGAGRQAVRRAADRTGGCCRCRWRTSAPRCRRCWNCGPAAAIDAERRAYRLQPARCRRARGAGGALRPGLARRRGVAGRWVSSCGSLAAFRPLRFPSHFLATLRPYQAEGVNWLQFLGIGRAWRRAGRRHGPRQDGADTGAPDDRESRRPAGPARR